MQITFILPGLSRFPVGGYKVVYQYANFFARLGHKVEIIHVENSSEEKVSFRRHLKDVAISAGVMGSKSIRWFTFHDGVHLSFVSKYNSSAVPDGDAVIATAWVTAHFVNDLPKSKGNKFYFIQHYEIQDGHKDLVDDTWRLSLKKIVIASWLKEQGNLLGVKTELVKNFVNHDEFYPTKPLTRSPAISMLVHSESWKGTQDGLRALEKVSAEKPDIPIYLFGVPERPQGLPFNFTYYQSASVDELRTKVYGHSSIYLFPSHTEGWGLTATEAMACGNALVSTSNGGVKDFGIDGENAKIVPIGDSQAMADAILFLLDNTDTLLSYQNESIQIAGNLTIQSSGTKFLNILQGGA